MADKPEASRSAKATTKSKKKASEKEKSQRERFIETAREVGVDESGKEFERLFSKVAPAKSRLD